MGKKNRRNEPGPRKPVQMKKIQYQGYVVVQSSRNHHIMIGKDGKMVHHAQCDHPLTEDELRKEVDDYLLLRGGL